jgi:hypothetical protein
MFIPESPQMAQMAEIQMARTQERQTPVDESIIPGKKN